MTTNERDTYLLDITILTIDEILAELFKRPVHCLILQCSSYRRIDIGSLCYLERNYKHKKIPKPVCLSSLSYSRSALILQWCIENISKCKTSSSGETLFANAEELATFTNWCDGGAHTDFHLSPHHYKRALDAYSQNLINRLQSEKGEKVNGISRFRANRLQSAAINNATLFFPSSPINHLENLPIISNNNGGLDKGEKTATPLEQEIAEYLTSCQYMFDGLTDFVLKGLTFPHNFAHGDIDVLLVPTEFYISTPLSIALGTKARNSFAWDYARGSIRSIEEAKAVSFQASNNVTRTILEAHYNLRKANEDPRHPKRLMIGQFAQAAFIPLFAANSAMNESQLINLKWSPSYELEKSDNSGFVVIKNRAGDLEQRFELRKTFVKHFKKFLKLRAYLCGEKTPELLFLKFTWNELQSTPIKAPIEHFNIKMRHFVNPKFRGLTYRELRKYKSVYLLSHNYSVSVVSAVIQNSQNTTLKHYSEANEKVAIDEISATLSYIINILDKESKIDTPSGGCGGGTSSTPDTPPDEYKPNCRNFVGCIYCSEYRLHSDEESIRKILSMRFVTAERLTSCTDMDQFQALHGKALERIDAIISDLIKIKPDAQELVDRIKSDIKENFKLSSYWETLYSRLLRLKVIK